MLDRNRLSSYIVDQLFDSSYGECNVRHLNTGYVAITLEGLREHDKNDLFNKITLGAGVGLAAIPTAGAALGSLGWGLVGTGISGGASIGALEVAAAPASIGTAVGAAAAHYTAVTGHKTTKTTGSAKAIQLVNMVGTCYSRQSRWWGQPGYDIQIQWKIIDQWGEFKTQTSWHDPEYLVSMTYVS